MDLPSWRDRAWYVFDNFMARGTIALIAGLFAVSAVGILVVAGIVAAAGLAHEEGLDFPGILWRSLLRTLDASTIGLEEGPAGFLAAMLVVVFGGIFVISTLIGIINTGIEGRLAELRKGRSRVVERGHTVILGWSHQVHTIVAELVEAAASHRGTVIVILADRDPAEMQDEIRGRLRSTGRTRLVYRRGSPIDIDDLRIASLRTSKSIIVLSPEIGDPDADVIKTILAITNHPERRTEPYHIVAEIRDPINLEIARLIGRDELVPIPSEDVVSRITAQTCRQSGLSTVYEGLLDFEGNEIYFAADAAMIGRTYGEALHAFVEASVIGIRPAGGQPIVNPPMDTVLGPDDRLVVIAPDEDRIRPAAEPPTIDLSVLRTAPDRPANPERTLVLGWNRRGPAIVGELDAYVAPGSEVVIVADRPTEEVAKLVGSLVHQRIDLRRGDPTQRLTLTGLGIEAFDHVVVLGDSDRLDPQQADGRTLITLLHLRNLMAERDSTISIVSEILDVRNLALADVARPDDIIVSERLVSLMVAQVAEAPELGPVFTELLNPAGSEIYLKPAGDYVALGQPVTFASIIEAARRRGESAFGLQVAARSRESSAAYGVVINPAKAPPWTLVPGDRVIVLADS
jgi:voltage-gated potassium channel Kch